MLFSYDPPSPIKIVADGTWVHFVDKELKQTTHALIADTTVDFFTRDQLRLSGDITVTGFARNGNRLNVTVVDSANPGEGQVTFAFDAEPLTLREWTVVDPEGQETLVGLLELEPNVNLDGNMFYWYEGDYD